MSATCHFCAKKPKVTTTRVRLRATKFNPTTTHRQKPNLQWFTLESGKRVKACTKCIKSRIR